MLLVFGFVFKHSPFKSNLSTLKIMLELNIEFRTLLASRMVHSPFQENSIKKISVNNIGSLGQFLKGLHCTGYTITLAFGNWTQNLSYGCSNDLIALRHIYASS